jgi:prophage regulatory protein
MTVKVLIKLIEAKHKLAVSRSTYYSQIKEGLITKPVKIGDRAVGWPSNEIDAIVDARIAGKSKSEIKALVIKLESQRTNKAEV